ncbi:MAG TPA: sialidase family protein [Ktedonobacteraceae bacterium]|nr:sialidase family protein [Ktedonobacteraceae bacterium]
MRKLFFACLSLALLFLLACTPASTFAQARAVTASSGVGNIPQGTQTDAAFAKSVTKNNVTNVFATSQQTSCYTPEVPYSVSNGPNDGYSGESPCNGAATTGENTGPYPTQVGSNPDSPAAAPVLVKDHSESDIRVDPTNPSHLIGSSKWFVSPEGYNHLLGFYESFDSGKTWSVQGHIPGYEGWTDNTDPVGAFDAFGNYYEFILAYQFFYEKDGTHNFTVGTSQEPNPSIPAEVVAVSVHPHGAMSSTNWMTTHNAQPDYIATYDSVGGEPDKQWITIDTNKFLPNGSLNPNYNTIYAMWTLFNGVSSKPYVSTSRALPDGTHTDWSVPQLLPTVNNTAGDTYLLPHVDPAGVVYTTVTNFPAKKSFCCITISVDKSLDGGKTWQAPQVVIRNVQSPPARYANTTFRDGIEDTFAVGNHLSAQGYYPLYVAWEDYSQGVGNNILSASYDGGLTWSGPIQVNDNASLVDEFQPNLTVASDGTVSVAFYDRRLSCPAAGTTEAVNAGLALDQSNPAYTGSLPPYGASNYCINASVQFYNANLAPLGNNIRLTQHSWDPQLNAAHTSSASGVSTFIGDYFGNTTSGSENISSFVSTYNDGSNPAYRQQQVVAIITIP